MLFHGRTLFSSRNWLELRHVIVFLMAWLAAFRPGVMGGSFTGVATRFGLR
jgi:hypothetical protein